MTKRNLFAVVLLSYITLGIYVIYWLYATRLELLRKHKDKNAIPPVSTLFLSLLPFVGFLILAIAWEDSVAVLAASLSMMAVLAFFAWIVFIFWWMYKFFYGFAKVVGGNDPALMYVLWVAFTMMGIGPLWVLISQSDINTYVARGNKKIPKSS